MTKTADPRMRIERVNIFDIDAEPLFQRPVTSMAHTVTREFDWRLLDVIKVARNGKDYLADGKQRVTGMRNLMTNDPERAKRLGLDGWVDAIIVPVKSEQEAAGLYCMTNTQRKAMTPANIYAADLVWRTPGAVFIADNLRARGLSVAPRGSIHEVAAIQALRRAGELLPHILDIITGAWMWAPGMDVDPAIRARLSGAIIDAFRHYLTVRRDVDGELPTTSEVIQLIARGSVHLGADGPQSVSPLMLSVYADRQETTKSLSSGNRSLRLASALGHALHGRTWSSRYSQR